MQKSGGKVKRIIHHKSLNMHYSADACIVWCFDDRFSELLERLKEACKFEHIDTIRVAGGAKGLATPESADERKYVLSQIAKSLALHNAPQVVLMVHSNCGDYGKKFADQATEEQFYFYELDKAESVLKEFLKNKRPEVKIVKYFADFDGILERS